MTPERLAKIGRLVRDLRAALELRMTASTVAERMTVAEKVTDAERRLVAAVLAADWPFTAVEGAAVVLPPRSSEPGTTAAP